MSIPTVCNRIIEIDNRQIYSYDGNYDYYLRRRGQLRPSREECTFSYSLDGKKFIACGTPFTARQGHWIGARIGLFSVQPAGKNRGWMDIDWFRITK